MGGFLALEGRYHLREASDGVGSTPVENGLVLMPKRSVGVYKGRDKVLSSFPLVENSAGSLCLRVVFHRLFFTCSRRTWDEG